MPNQMLKILVVDDDQLVGRALARALHGHQPVIETNPRAAQRRLNEGEWFDVVLCDTRMPEVSGFDVLSAVRSIPDPPIFVLMSGDDEITAANADATLHKPFSASHMLDLVSILVEKKRCAPTQPLPVVRPRTAAAGARR